VGASGEEGKLDSSMPSAKLEQDAQMLGLRDSKLPRSAIGSPQQMQIRGVITMPQLSRPVTNKLTVPAMFVQSAASIAPLSTATTSTG
jgi:hypothetical protein